MLNYSLLLLSVYEEASPEYEKWRSSLVSVVSDCQTDELALSQNFYKPDPKWRGGIQKSSFNYLLLDAGSGLIQLR